MANSEYHHHFSCCLAATQNTGVVHTYQFTYTAHAYI